ncbi:MAG TPA: hypothetical protein VFJ85_13995 [Acidimicrobiales bacterium]|nr:hypothetical protein [Acidimicrobiales bacterium]
MYTFAVTVLLGLALFKIVDVTEDLAPGTARFHGLLTLTLAVLGAFAIDFSLFQGFGVALRETWMGTLLTGVAIAGTTSVWRAAFHWLGSSDGEEPAARHPRRSAVRAA